MKLTIHDACWDAAASPWSDKALQAGVKWLKVIDDPARAYAVALAYPKVNVIYRRVMPSDIEQLSDIRKHPEFRDAQACAEMLVRWADIKPLCCFKRITIRLNRKIRVSAAARFTP